MGQTRGRVYGTILVDLERHQVIDLLTDRTAETLAPWLRSHPGVKIVARERSLEYARGISEGAPQAIQVADRWHLLVNLREALQRLLDHLRPELNALLPAAASAKPTEIPVFRHRPRSQATEITRQTRKQQRQALHAEIQRLQKKELPIRTIAHQLGKSPTTIYKYLAMPEFPQKTVRKHIASILDPYQDYLSQRWHAGCRNARQLWHEIQQRGYPGTYRQVSSRLQPLQENTCQKTRTASLNCVPSDHRQRNRAYRSPGAWSGCFFIPLKSWRKKK